MQNVRSPRIYVDLLSYLKALDILNPTTYNGGIENYFDIEGNNSDFDLIGLNPSSVCQLKEDSAGTDIDGNDKIIFHSKIDFNQLLPSNVFHAILGHNLSRTKSNYFVELTNLEWVANEDIGINWTNDAATGSLVPQYDGFSLAYDQKGVTGEGKKIEFRIKDQSGGVDLYSQGYPYIGSLVFGNYYDFPSPDLKLTQTIDMDGVKHQTTKGGVKLSDVKYSGSAKWGDYGAWELVEWSESTGNLTSWSRNGTLGARTGRRIWDLSFSYMSDADMFPDMSLGGQALTDVEIGDNLVANPTFVNQIFWVVGDDWSISGGVASYDGSGCNYVGTLISSLVAGKRYKISLDVVTDSGNPLVAYLGGEHHHITGTGYIEFELTCGSVNKDLRFIAGDTGGGRWNGNIDNISVTEIREDINLLEGNDFVSSVWNRTLGGRLPFIFQADSNNNNPDQFAICKFDQDSLDIDRVAHNVYNIKLKIREIW